jgi:hypothetical protein
MITDGVEWVGVKVMASRMKPAEGAMTLAEMKEFAGFSAATQRYVRRALDIGLEREDAMERWSRDVVEASPNCAR